MHEALAAYAADVAPSYEDRAGRTDRREHRPRRRTGDGGVAGRALQRAGRHGQRRRPATAVGRRRRRGGRARTARELAGRFQLESLGELALKGKAERVEAHRVIGEASPETVSESPLVGRDRELAALVDALAGLEDGFGAIVSITGEPGIGKSRLVAEARAGAPAYIRFLAGHGRHSDRGPLLAWTRPPARLARNRRGGPEGRSASS